MFFLLNVTVFSTISALILSATLNQEFEWAMFLNMFGILILALTFGSAIRISRDSFVRRQQEKDAELKLLKAQLNPHFLFNTLNNLYGLSVAQSDRLPDLMLKLSDLLRYSLYDTRETYVPLEKEVQYLENYMSLEKIRLEETTAIAFERSGNLSTGKIAPMLLIVFVENAFKHLGGAQNEKNKVRVSIGEAQGRLTFVCENTLDPMGVQGNGLESGKSGIGLENAKKRLAILYPDKHQLAVSVGDQEYQVTLTIDL